MTGIEGNYRITCERVLHLLRANKESLLAVLEAFVYDPLINWRLLNSNIFINLFTILCLSTADLEQFPKLSLR